MTLTATAPVSDNHTAIWVVLALLTVFAIVAVLWQHERISDRQRAEIAWLRYQMRHLLKHLNLDIPKPVKDDSPKAMAAASKSAEKPDEMPTGPIEIAPATVPDGMPLAVQSALIEQRPSPVPRETEWVERTVNIGGTLQTYRIPAKREEGL